MENRIGLWKKCNEEEKHVGELIIDNNHLEFYVRDTPDPFSHLFFGYDEDSYYKVFVNGRLDNGHNTVLNKAICLHPIVAIRQNQQFNEEETDFDKKDIVSFSFIIPELIDWINRKTIQLHVDNAGGLYASELKCEHIILKESNPKAEIVFESESIISTIMVDDRITSVIKNQPRISVVYQSAVNIDRVQKDIDIIMQFWGLLIGHVSDAEDIQIKNTEKMKSLLFINRDVSYNLLYISFVDKPRTTFNSFEDKIADYFDHWYSFCANEQYDFIRKMYFACNKRKEILAEDILVQYVRILEGYHLRITGDEIQSKAIENAFKKVEKDIKKLIFTDEGKPLFEAAFKESVPDWVFNAKHALNISQWIAKGFLSRKSLIERLKSLDNDYFNIISKNAVATLYPKEQDEYKNDTAAPEMFFNKIVITRNYYSHYKADKTNVLAFSQMNDTINTLKALIIMILFTNMGMDKELIRQIMENDSELHFQTGFIRKTESERVADKD